MFNSLRHQSGLSLLELTITVGLVSIVTLFLSQIMLSQHRLYEGHSRSSLKSGLAQDSMDLLEGASTEQAISRILSQLGPSVRALHVPIPIDSSDPLKPSLRVLQEMPNQQGSFQFTRTQTIDQNTWNTFAPDVQQSDGIEFFRDSSGRTKNERWLTLPQSVSKVSGIYVRKSPPTQLHRELGTHRFYATWPLPAINAKKCLKNDGSDTCQGEFIAKPPLPLLRTPSGSTPWRFRFQPEQQRCGTQTVTNLFTKEDSTGADLQPGDWVILSSKQQPSAMFVQEVATFTRPVACNDGQASITFKKPDVAAWNFLPSNFLPLETATLSLSFTLRPNYPTRYVAPGNCDNNTAPSPHTATDFKRFVCLLDYAAKRAPDYEIGEIILEPVRLSALWVKQTSTKESLQLTHWVPTSSRGTAIPFWNLPSTTITDRIEGNVIAARKIGSTAFQLFFFEREQP